MKIYPQIKGQVTFDERPVTITDPCYDKGSRFTQTVQVKPGKYTCVSYRGTDRYTVDGKRYSDTRTWVIGVYLNGKLPPPSAWDNPEVIGKIAVDAGLAGFYQDKPDFDDDWMEFCEPFCRPGRAAKNERIDDYGFTSSSGLGDGYYEVWAYRNEENEIVGLEVHF